MPLTKIQKDCANKLRGKILRALIERALDPASFDGMVKYFLQLESFLDDYCAFMSSLGADDLKEEAHEITINDVVYRAREQLEMAEPRIKLTTIGSVNSIYNRLFRPVHSEKIYTIIFCNRHKMEFRKLADKEQSEKYRVIYDRQMMLLSDPSPASIAPKG